MPTDKGEPEAKRTREACLNCRRKKTRCPGERPACEYCLRLGQACEYASDERMRHSSVSTASTAVASAAPVSLPASVTAAPQEAFKSPLPPGVDLAARVTQLEAQLRAQLETGARRNSVAISHDASDFGASYVPQKRKLTADSEIVLQTPVSISDRMDAGSVIGADQHCFTTPPPAAILKHLVDVYFLNCHNQPYCFFHEASLRRNFLADAVPQYLQLAIAATAVRYSRHEYYKDNQDAAIRAYARASWLILLERFFASDHHPDVAMAQATALLAVTEFVAGHHHVGWVKVGLAIRLIQDLKLNSEPDPTLSDLQREETRRIFWSIYVLDKFFACSRIRPVSVLDSDCTVALPCSEELFREEMPGLSMPTLAAARDLSNFDSRSRIDGFAGLVTMCSLLSRCMRNFLQSKNIISPIWDHRSDFSKTSSFLLSFETMHTAGEHQLDAYVAERFGTYEGYDRQKAGHFVWARGIYHLCGVLLYHPLALYRNRQTYARDFPPTLAHEALSRYRHHLSGMTNVVKTVQSTACCARGSFLGYLAACAAFLHKISIQSTDEATAVQSKASLETCTSFLDQAPVCWTNYRTMALAVKSFEVEPDVANHLLDLALPVAFEINPTQADNILRAVDYAWLSDPGPSKFHAASAVLDLNATRDAVSPFARFTNGASFDLMAEADFNFDPRTLDTSPFYGLFNEI